MNMTCSSYGLPAPKILWSRQLNNGDLQPLSENTTLTLISTKMEDSGIYVCEGINQVGKSRKEVQLVIQGEINVTNGLLVWGETRTCVIEENSVTRQSFTKVIY